jgi:hypothetical protein
MGRVACGRARGTCGLGGAAIVSDGFKSPESASAGGGLIAVEGGCMGFVAMEPSMSGGAAASGPSDIMAGR